MASYYVTSSTGVWFWFDWLRTGSYYVIIGTIAYGRTRFCVLIHSYLTLPPNKPVKEMGVTVETPGDGIVS